MPAVFEYRCRECGKVRESMSRDDAQACSCGGLSRRCYRSVQFGRAAFVPHFNYSVGQHVNNRREFEDELKRKADNNSEQTGMDHSYAALDPSELSSMQPKTDTAIFEDQARAFHDKDIHPVEASPDAF